MVPQPRWYLFLLVFTLFATPLMAQPLTKVLDLPGFEVVAFGDFNNDGRPDLITQETYFGNKIIGIRDAQTGIRWLRVLMDLPPGGFETLQYWDLDQDGRQELLVQDLGEVHCIKVPALPPGPLHEDMLEPFPNWHFTYPTNPVGSGGAPPPFQFDVASFNGTTLHFLYRDRIQGGTGYAYRLRNMNGGLAQTINEPFFGTYYELWDMDQDGRPEIVLLPSNPADNPELFMHVYKWTTTLDAGASGALGAPSLSLLGANPARGSSTFSYSLPTASNAEVVVYDLQGRAVRTLARGPAKAGVHQATWDGEDRDGRKVPSGQYYVQFSSNGTSLGRKIICLR